MKALVATDDVLNGLRYTLSKASFVQLLGFSCACVERWLPYVGLISQDNEHLCRDTINICWETIVQASSTESWSPYVAKVNTLADLAMEKREIYEGLSPQIYEDVIVAILYTLKYAIHKRVEFAVLSADRTRDAAFQLAQNFLGTKIYPSDTVLTLYEMEVNQQYKDLRTLKVNSATQATVDSLRSESNTVSFDIQYQITEYVKRRRDNPQNGLDVIALWLRSLNDPVKVIRQQASLKLLESSDPYVTEQLLAIEAEIEDPDILGIIAFGFGKWRERKAIPFLTRLLENGTTKQKKIAAIALNEIRDK
ncbi:MAG: hypothetical protein U0175_04075 [Caldilineaceae bacterium]